MDLGLNLSDRKKDKNNNEYYLTVKGAETDKFAAVDVPNPSRMLVLSTYPLSFL